jgi:hypothetical protein
LQSCAKSLQAHVAIVEAVAETMRGDVNEKAMDKLEDLLFLATEVRNAATAIEVVSNDNVSRLISGSILSSYVLPQFLEWSSSASTFHDLGNFCMKQLHRHYTLCLSFHRLTHPSRSTRRSHLLYQQRVTLVRSRKCNHPRS